jgi:hypothetical protein
VSQDQNQPEATGSSQAEAAEALFDLLGSEEGFSEEPQAETNDAIGDEEQDDVDPEYDLDEEEFSDSTDEDEVEHDESEDDAELESEEQEEALYEVTLPGGETAEVSLQELQAGYSRTEDYTRKRQRDAAQHATLMTEMQGKRDDYANRLEVLEQTLRDIGPQRPTEELRLSNPGEYAAQMADWQMYERTLAAVGTERTEVTDQISQEHMTKHQEYVTQEWNKLVDIIPAWSDQNVAQQELSNIREFATKEYGFTEEDLSAVSDSRVVLMLKENMELRQGNKEAKKSIKAKKAKKGRLRPGAQQKRVPNKSRRKAAQAAAEKASKTGSVTDAAEAILLTLED